MLKTSLLSVVLGCAAVTLGCGGDDDDSARFTADFSGMYTVALTNTSVNAMSSSCPFRDSMPGQMSVGIGFTIAQDGSAVTGTADPISAAILGLTIGNANFEGSVSGSNVAMLASGTRPFTEGTCAYFLNANLNGTISENALSGTVSYTPSTNDNPNCASLVCSATQEFSGSRPPQ